MQVIDWDDFINAPLASEQPTAITIGVFDGVHRGHQVLIRRICAGCAVPAVVTFRENPLRVLSPQNVPLTIYSLEKKLELLREFGVKQTVLIDFSENFSKISGRDFIDLLLKGRRVELLALGRNFRCGRGQTSGVEAIRTQAAGYGTDVWVAEPLMEGGAPISSSRIRQAIAAGNADEVSLLLGRPYEIGKI